MRACVLLLVGLSVPSHECRIMSYLLRLAASSHHGATDVKAAPPSAALNLFVPSTPAKKLTRPLPASGVNSESEMPILRSKHSRASAPPVVRAILGRWPSLWLRGSRVASAATAVSAQAGTLSIVTWRRHRPTWITSGMPVPTGTSLALSPSVKLPVASVFACTTGAPDSTIAQVSQAGPSVYGASAALGTKISTLGSGTLPAG